MNNSTATWRPSSRLDAWETSIAWVGFSLITTTGLVGNLLVIIAIVGSASMRQSAMNLLMMNLAIADFLNLFSCSVDWIQILLAGYVATAHPLHVRQICTNWSLVFWVLGIWIISATFALPYALTYRVKRWDGWVTPIKRCTPSVQLSAAFKTAECLSFYFIPLVLLAVLYWRIARLLWSNTSYLHESIRQSGREAALARIRGRRRVVKMLVCCVGVYFICFSPLQFMFVSQVVFKARVLPPFSVVLAMNALCYASSACNPILYTLFSTRFRVRFAQLLFAACGCGRPAPALLPNWIVTRPRSRSRFTVTSVHSNGGSLSFRQKLLRSGPNGLIYLSPATLSRHAVQKVLSIVGGMEKVKMSS
uniref:G-protein coupled receptors family 1 profile domain-containing protein n=1 Tax=Plectus sambesii TaxID=2011161 RepID=A0A914UXT1_9BILA